MATRFACWKASSNGIVSEAVAIGRPIGFGWDKLKAAAATTGSVRCTYRAKMCMCMGCEGIGAKLCNSHPPPPLNMSRSKFIEQFAGWFDPEPILQLARQSRWYLRRGKIQAFEFLVGLVFGQMSALRLSLSSQAS